MATYQCKVKTNGGNLRIRKLPNTSSTIVGSMANGTEFLSSKTEGGWYYIPANDGWCSGTYVQVIRMVGSESQEGDGSSSTTTPEESYENREWANTEVSLSQFTTMSDLEKRQIEQIIGSDAYKEAVGGNNSNESFITKSTEGIYGLPYQFMNSVDRKIDGTNFGYTYADKIITRMPLLLMTPGRVNFGRGFKSKSALAQTIQKLIDESSPTNLDALVDNQGRYYTFDEDYVQYYKYVDAMCMTGAYYLGIENVQIKSNGKWQKIKDVEWANAGNSAFKGILSKKEYVAFYVDSASSVSESFSNSTTESQLANKVNSLSDAGREIAFLTGAITGYDAKHGDDELIQQANDTIDKIASQYLNNNQLFKDIASNFATVAVGGKLIFPEIWADSSYSKSYDINIKLRTPDGDKVSWFMNIYVPLAHLICLTAARSAPSGGGNAYAQPFLIRAYYKGLFNCDMGIITDMSITRGREKAWTLDGFQLKLMCLLL